MPKSPVQPTPYPIYRESNPNKFYIPRSFGINTFGEPNEIKIEDGLHQLTLKFEGTIT